MSAKQPEALRLADELEDAAGDYYAFHKKLGYGASAELRRLHAANLDCMAWFEAVKSERDELLEFAKEWLNRQGSDENYMTTKAREAIFKATGEAK